MKKLILFVGIFFSILLSSSTAVSAGVNDFTIDSFDADYYLTRNDEKVSQLRVKETITARFPNFEQNRGILRAIPKTYQGNSVGFKILSVKDETGNNRNFTTYEENDNEVIKIGDADRFVLGRQVYVIEYTSEDVVSLLDDHDEFYWDINGDQWLQPFGSVTARIHIPSDLAKDLQDRQVCFAGEFGTITENCSIARTETDDEVLITANAKGLLPAETLTTVIAFNDGTFEAKPFPWAAVILAILAFLAPPLLALIYIIRKWSNQGRDDAGKGIVIPQYLPEKGSNVVTADIILNEKLQPKTISAAVIELATTKRIVITEKGGKDYEFELTKKVTSSGELKEVANMIFGEGASVGTVVELKSLKYKLSTKIKKLNHDTFKKLTADEYFKHTSNESKKKISLIGVVLFVVAFFFFFTPYTIPVAISLILSAIIFLIGSAVMAARTVKGTEARNYLLGIKDYIKLAEVDRIKYLQTPEATKRFGDIKDNKVKIKLFEKLLPYAMLFGLEKEWAKDFKDIYAEPPDWYHGNWSTFNTVALASSMNSFASTSAQSFSPPSSSGGSGFSGGGSSGGGGGGGGGGGW